MLDLPDDRNELKEMCARAGVPYSPKDALERVKNRLREGAAFDRAPRARRRRL